MSLSSSKNRREFLQCVGAAGGAAMFAANQRLLSGESAAPQPLTVAAVVTAFTPRSHAHVILENFLEPYLFNGKVTAPGTKVVSLYIDQFPADDMGRKVAAEYGFTIYPTIAQALCRGGDKLAVDAILSIGEQGHYPQNAKGQTEYPRKRFFDEIAQVCRRSGRGVPLFSDKHLSYRWDWAKEMYDTAKRLEMPLMAGSSVPLAERRPPLEIKPGAKIREAVSIHGGSLEAYDFHGLEVLQSMVEFRAGGETGVKQVQFLEGDALWKAADDGGWSIELAQTALATELGADHELTKALGRRGKTPRGEAIRIHGISLVYADGLKGIVLKLADSGTRWCFARRIEGEPSPRATRFYVGPWENRNLFKALSHAIQTHFRERRPPYPVERTLLTTGMVAAAMDSRAAAGKPLDTPHLAFGYEARDYSAMREMGATWKIITEGIREPNWIDHAPR
jgi:hypothetical protein